MQQHCTSLWSFAESVCRLNKKTGINYQFSHPLGFLSDCTYEHWSLQLKTIQFPHNHSASPLRWWFIYWSHLSKPPTFQCVLLVAQMVKNLPAMQETQVWSLVWEDHLEKGPPSPIRAWIFLPIALSVTVGLDFVYYSIFEDLEIWFWFLARFLWKKKLNLTVNLSKNVIKCF